MSLAWSGSELKEREVSLSKSRNRPNSSSTMAIQHAPLLVRSSRSVQPKSFARTQSKASRKLRMTLISVVEIGVVLICLVSFVLVMDLPLSGMSPPTMQRSANLVLPMPRSRRKARRAPPRISITPHHVQEAALNFVRKRETVYANQGMRRHWTMRGVGWLYTEFGVVLTATVLPLETSRNAVHIYNVGNATEAFHCEKLTIWVRVAGPEIFAGSAIVIQDSNSTCHWEFPFLLQQTGQYKVEAKVLLWDGKTAVHQHDCKVDKDMSTLKSYNRHEGLMGFKFYYPYLSCCEICTRTPDCVQWAYPPFGAEKGGCEFFYSDKRRRLTDDTEMADRAHGGPRYEPAARFLGCGWSFALAVDYPCLDPSLDDSVHMLNEHFTFDSPSSPKNKRLPSCKLRDEVYPTGRWIQMDWPSNDSCPTPMDTDETHSTHFETNSHDGNNPRCWFREDLARIGQHCVEAGCSKWLPKAWRSSLKETNQWFGKWQPYNCNYMELTNHQLQQCIDSRKIGSFVVEGESIARYVKQYLAQRLDGLKLYIGNDRKEIVLSTFSFPHLLWKEDEDGWRRYFQRLRVLRQNQEFYWLSGFYYSSEREPFVHVERSQQLTEFAQRELRGRGYRMLQAMDLTAAFTFDSATQMDGLHIIGPPMKMIITKLFHHVCFDHLESLVDLQ